MSRGSSTTKQRRLRGYAIAALAVAVLAGCQYGETKGADQVSDVFARVHGTVHSSDPAAKYWFEYDDDPHVVEGVGLVFDSSTLPGFRNICCESDEVSDIARDLAPDTTYYYRLCIRNEDGRGWCGAPASFHTKPDDRDVVSGSISVPDQVGLYPILTLNVRANPDNSEAAGEVTLWRAGLYKFPDIGDATCLRIVGNRAAIGIQALTIFGPSAGFKYEVIYVEDNGATGDRWEPVIVSSAVLTCPDPSTADVTWTTSTAGNITITDN